MVRWTPITLVAAVPVRVSGGRGVKWSQRRRCSASNRYCTAVLVGNSAGTQPG